MLNDIEAI